ncbi:MAG: TraR/DksA family transcriptional regulator [Phycisphaerales bacterium]
MAKKPASKSKKKTAKSSSRKKTTKKASSRAAKKTAKKTTKKKVAKKTTKKKVAKKTTKKAAPKKAAKTSTAKKPTSKKPVAKKSTAKKAASKKTPASKPAAKDSASKSDDKKSDDKKSGRKGITIVSDKPSRRSKPAPPKASKFPPPGPRLLGPGSKLRKPLIPSGPSTRDAAAAEETTTSKRKKTPFTKKQLENYKAILIAKRNELVGDVTQMETDALRSNSGGLSNTPQHLAEQGSDSADQSLNLNLAAADRRLIKQIDAALDRIADRTYGLCLLTNEPISKDRLEELPWAEYSIEAARQLELRGGLR